MFRDFGTQGKKHKINKPPQNHGGGGYQPTYKSVGNHANENDSFSMKGALKNLDKATAGQSEFDMDGFKHNLALYSAIGAWAISIYFAYEGFKFENTSVLWVGWVLAILVTCGEFIFNTEIRKLTVTLLLIGLICYLYGIYSNVVGFWSVQNPTLPFPWFDKSAAMSWFVGSILEIYPEAAFAWGVRAYTGDFFGNIVTLISTRGQSVGTKVNKQSVIREDLKDRIGH